MLLCKDKKNNLFIHNHNNNSHNSNSQVTFKSIDHACTVLFFKTKALPVHYMFVSRNILLSKEEILIYIFSPSVME